MTYEYLTLAGWVRLHGVQRHPLEHVLALLQRLYRHAAARVGEDVQQLLHLGEALLALLLVTDLGDHGPQRLDVLLQGLDLLKVLPVLVAGGGCEQWSDGGY